MEARCPKCAAVFFLTEDELQGSSVAFVKCADCGDTFFFDRAFAELPDDSSSDDPSESSSDVRETIQRELMLRLDQTQVTELKGRAVERPIGPADSLLPDSFSIDAYPPRGELTVYVVSGPDRGLYYQITGDTVLLGRSKGGIVIHDPEASRQHAQLERHGRGRFFLRDLRSTNGTYLNEAQVQYSELRDRDLLRIGKTLLLTRFAGSGRG
ncbi:MAG: FHA domain-containing protein [Candidatus Schekmanbacteria bacterium]|nr:FHA domain-containing protein [Candidatus Schekmanbacteria bacterium]